MKSGPLWKVTLETSAEAEDAVGALLERLCGQPASACFDLETGRVTVSVFLPKSRSQPPLLRARIRDGLDRLRAAGVDPAPGRVSVRSLPPEDWAESWKRHFKPLPIGRALLICPSWIRPRPRPGQAVVTIDPGLSFGTGQHPTTAFCLAQIAACRQPRTAQSFLDAGCGSGILAIAAAKLGYQPVEAFDFDPDAVRVARENALQNGALLRLRRADVRRLPLRGGRRFDLVCANLLYDLLVEQARRLIAQVRPGGRLVLAGILERQFEPVRRVFEEAGLTLRASSRRKEWKSGAFQVP